MALALDFRRPQRPLFRGPLWLRVAPILLTAGVSALLLNEMATLSEQQERLERRLAVLQRKEVQSPRPAILPGSEKLARIGGQLAAPWEAMFGAVERCRSDDVALLALVAEQGSGEASLRGEARNVDALKIFVDGLAAEKVFRQVVLTSHKPLPGGSGMLFEVRAKWR